MIHSNQFIFLASSCVTTLHKKSGKMLSYSLPLLPLPPQDVASGSLLHVLRSSANFSPSLNWNITCLKHYYKILNNTYIGTNHGFFSHIVAQQRPGIYAIFLHLMKIAI